MADFAAIFNQLFKSLDLTLKEESEVEFFQEFDVKVIGFKWEGVLISLLDKHSI